MYEIRGCNKEIPRIIRGSNIDSIDIWGNLDGIIIDCPNVKKLCTYNENVILRNMPSEFDEVFVNERTWNKYLNKTKYVQEAIIYGDENITIDTKCKFGTLTIDFIQNPNIAYLKNGKAETVYIHEAGDTYHVWPQFEYKKLEIKYDL